MKRILVAFWLSLAICAPALATSVIPLYLDEIVDQATVAFQGTCTENRTGRDPQTGLVVTFTTFRVEDVLKGDVPSVYTIKQIGGESPQEHLRVQIQGVPRFNVGEDYVVFLAGVSDKGFSSPIGLAQGRFTVLPATSGMKNATGPEVANGRDFKEMTSRIPAQALPPQASEKMRQPGPMRSMDLDEFKQLVRQQVAKGPK